MSINLSITANASLDNYSIHNLKRVWENEATSLKLPRRFGSTLEGLFIMNIETKALGQAGSSAGLAQSKSIIAVASGKGGVGKTWFSISLSHAFALKKSKVLLKTKSLKKIL